jgi:hypothetical protein
MTNYIFFNQTERHLDIQLNDTHVYDTHHNDTQHKGYVCDTQHNGILCIMLSVIMLNVVMLCRGANRKAKNL